MKNSKPNQQPSMSRIKPFNFLKSEGGNAMVIGMTSAGKTATVTPAKQGNAAASKRMRGV